MRLDARTDTPLLFATNWAEADSMLRHLVSRELLEKRADFYGGGGDYELTMKASQRVEELEHPQPQSRQGFIAMWFASHLDEAHIQGLRTAIRDAGYEPKRVDDDQFNERIDDRIIAGIQQSRFLVADVTGHRPAVYFEAGLAMGLGVPVVFTCHRDDLDKCPFDTRQYNHVVWESPEDLREKLAARIREAIPPSAQR
jgi:nucleoside 2-deoxyribosyltransferase